MLGSFMLNAREDSLFHAETRSIVALSADCLPQSCVITQWPSKVLLFHLQKISVTQPYQIPSATQERKEGKFTNTLAAN